MDWLAFVLGQLYENALDNLQFKVDVLESFAVVAEDMEAIVKRLEVLEHNLDLKVVGMIRPAGEA